MANPTTNYSFVLPTSTDLVTDLPADFDVALQGVDTRLKALQPGTTLGDLAYSSATANTNTRLGIGSTGQVLTVAGGVPSWATPAGVSFTSNTNFVATAETTSSTTFTGLTTAQSFSLVTGTKALVIIGCTSENNNATACTIFAGFAISGATTRAATDDTALSIRSNQSTVFGVAASQVIFATGLTAGTNTFTMQFKMGSGGNPGRWFNRSITVIDMGS
jgi:hypothetical protein